MSTGDVPAEQPWGFQREGDEKPIADLHAAAERLGRATFSVHGMVTSLGNLLEKVKEMITGLKSDGYEDPTEDAPPVPAGIAISGGGRFSSGKTDWSRRRNAIIDALLIAGIIALVAVTINLMRTTDRLEAAYSTRGELYDERFGSIARDNLRQDAELGRHDQRITDLERRQRANQPDADGR